MNPLRRLRLRINKLLAPVGLAIERTEKSPWPWNPSVAWNPSVVYTRAVVSTRVGGYDIQVPRLNPISTHYALHPNYSSQLGRLASLVLKNFSQMAAIDIGANVGDTACIIKSAGDIPLLCIEGDDLTFEFLQKNIKQFRNTAAHKVFLGERTEALAATTGKTGWNTTIQPDKTHSGQVVNVITLDDFLVGQSNIENFKLVKIDTEGFDCAIIRGAKNFLQRTLPVVTFEYNRDNMDPIGESGLDTLFNLEDLGYSRIVYHDFLGRYLCSTTLNDHSLISGPASLCGRTAKSHHLLRPHGFSCGGKRPRVGLHRRRTQRSRGQIL